MLAKWWRSRLPVFVIKGIKMKETVAMLNQQYVMPNGLTPYAGVTAKSPWLASESEKRQRKICD